MLSLPLTQAYIASSEEIQNEFEKDEEDLSSREEKLAKLQSKGSANPGKVEKAVADVERVCRDAALQCSVSMRISLPIFGARRLPLLQLRAFVDRKRVMLQEVTSNMEGQLQAFNVCT